MSATQNLASYLSKLKYEDLPPEVVEKGKVAIMDVVGNMIGGYSLSVFKIFLNMAKDLGGGRAEATLIGDGTKVNLPMAGFGNGALSTMLDYSDSHSNDSGRWGAWAGALAVPAALSAGESRGISGKELIASVVAGYECLARIVHSMEPDPEEQKLTQSTVSVFAAAGGAGRALGLDENEMLSTLGMAGIYTPVPAGYKWLYDEDLTPRKDIKQGWAWMCMTGTFAAVSAQRGLKMLQKNNVLDGERGLWRMLGMASFKEEALTAGFGETYHILHFSSKLWPGCAITHASIEGATSLVKEHSIALKDIERIEVITNRSVGIGFDALEFRNLSDREFSITYQVSAALLAGAGDRGPNWYSDRIANSPEVADMARRLVLSFDEGPERVLQGLPRFSSKVTILTKGGQRYGRTVDRGGNVRSGDEVRNKFINTTSQVIDRKQVDKILNTIDNLEEVGSVTELIELLHIPA